MIKLIVGCQYVFVEDLHPAKLFDSFYKHMSVPYPNFWFMKSWRDHTSDGRFHFFNHIKCYFPTGLLLYAEQFFIKGNHPYEIEDRREKIDIKYSDTTLKGVELRDYQKEAVREIVEKKNIIIHFATNSGKSEIGIGAIKIFLENNLKVLWLIHRVNLMYQTRDRMAKRLGISKNKIGIIGAGEWNTKHQLTISTIQTLSKAMQSNETKEFLKSIKVVISDECHHVKGDNWYKTMMRIPAVYRIGLSGTAITGEPLADMKLQAAVGMNIIHISNSFLISRGLSAIPTIYFHTIDGPRLPKDLDYGDVVRKKLDGFGNFQVDKNGNTIYELDKDGKLIFDSEGVYRLGVIKNDLLNNKIKEIAERAVAKGPVLIIIDRIEHGEILKEKLSELGAEFVYGETEPEEFQRVVKKFADGHLKILVASTIFDEGLDVPAIRTLILAASGKSEIRLLQRIGRGLRKKEEDNYLDVHDFVNCSHEYLLKHSSDRLEAYIREGFEIIDSK